MPSAGFRGEPGWMHQKRQIMNEDIKGKARNPNDIEVGQKQTRPWPREECVERYARQSESVSRFARKRTMNMLVAVIWEGVWYLSGRNGADGRHPIKRKTVIEEELADGIRHARWLWGEEAGAVNQCGHTEGSVPRSAEDQTTVRSPERSLGRTHQN